MILGSTLVFSLHILCQCTIKEPHWRRSIASVWTSFSRSLIFSLIVLTLTWAKVKCRSSCPSLFEFNVFCLFNLRFPCELSFVWFADFLSVFSFWDCPNDPESQHHGGYNLRHPKAWDSPRTVGPSQKPRTVLGRWDWPKGPESQHHGGYFSILENHNVTVRWLWDCPRSPGQSRNVGTVPKAQSKDNIYIVMQAGRNLLPKLLVADN